MATSTFTVEQGLSYLNVENIILLSRGIQLTCNNLTVHTRYKHIPKRFRTATLYNSMFTFYFKLIFIEKPYALLVKGIPGTIGQWYDTNVVYMSH